MGALVGLMFGLEVFALWRSPSPARTSRPRWSERIDETLLRANVESVSAAQLLVVSAVLAGFTFLLTWAISQSPPIGVAFACFSSLAPLSLMRWRARQRSAELRELWPEVTDNIASGVRAGLSLPEALMQLGVRGPEQLRSLPALRRGLPGDRSVDGVAEPAEVQPRPPRGGSHCGDAAARP